MLSVSIAMLASSLRARDVSPKPELPERPNVLLILVDDMGIGDICCFGQKAFKTPNIDKLASEGIVFTNFYTGSTVSAPSRASLMTGKTTGHCSVRGNMPAQLLGDNEMTLAKVMKEAGYATGAIGKWGIGHPPPIDDPKRKGFDYFYGYVNMLHAHNCFPEFLYKNGEKVFLKNKLKLLDGKNPWADLPEGTGVSEVKIDYAPLLFDDEAINFIEKNKNDNFFLYLAYNLPHANNEAKPNGLEVPSYGEFADRNWPDSEKGFASMMRILDNSVGKMMQKLRELGIDKKTMIIFCSDNGPHQEGGHLVSYFDSNGKYRGMKRDLYDGGVRTPFIIHWPGVVKAGTTSDYVGAFWDILPTFCDLVGVKKPKETDGISILPTILGNKKEQKNHEYLYWEFFEQGGKQALLKDNWKAIKLNVRDKSKPEIFELYNLDIDFDEKHDVSKEQPALVSEFNELFKKARKEFSVVSLFEEEN